MARRLFVLVASLAAAGAWPMLVSAMGAAFMSPLQRAAREAYCGSGLHGNLELLGHCVACWAGSAFLVATGLAVFFSNRRDAATARAR